MSQNNRKYSDLRHKFIRGLIPLEKFQRSRHYLKSAAECTSRAIVSLDLCDTAIKSVKQATQLDGIGNVLADKLTEIHTKNDKINADPPKPGKFTSSASAFLVAFLNLKEANTKLCSEPSTKKIITVSEAALCKATAWICEETFLPDDSSGFCAAKWRLNILCSRGMIKKRSVNKAPVYELLPYGEQVALHLRGEISEPVGTSPLKNKRLHQSPKKLQDRNRLVDALYTNDRGQEDGVILLVDSREGGGDKTGLSQITNMIEKTSLIYQTKVLQTGDYQWFYRADGKEYSLPILIERKRGDDLANSVVDGRFFDQITKMKAWADAFVNDYSIHMNGQLKYLIEGDLDRYVVRCQDGCRGVGKCGNPTSGDLQEIIDDLDQTPDFTVIRSEDLQGTVDALVMLTADIKQRLKSGEFKALFPNGMPLKNLTETKENNNHVIYPNDAAVLGNNTASKSNNKSSKSAAVGKSPNLDSGNEKLNNQLGFDSAESRTKSEQTASGIKKPVSDNQLVNNSETLSKSTSLKGDSHTLSINCDNTTADTGNLKLSTDNSCTISRNQFNNSDDYCNFSESQNPDPNCVKTSAKRKTPPTQSVGKPFKTSRSDVSATTSVSDRYDVASNLESTHKPDHDHSASSHTDNVTNAIVVAAEIHTRPNKSASRVENNDSKPVNMWIADYYEVDEIVEAPVMKTSQKSRSKISPSWTNHRSVLEDDSPPKPSTSNSSAVKDLYNDNTVNDLYFDNDKDDRSVSPILKPSKIRVQNSSAIGGGRQLNFSDILKQDVKRSGSDPSYNRHRNVVEIDSDDDSLPEISFSKSNNLSPADNKKMTGKDYHISGNSVSTANVVSAPKFENESRTFPMDKSLSQPGGSASSFTDYRSPDKTKEKWKNEIETIRCIVPQATCDEMTRALEIHFGNVENAIGMLLDEYM